MAQAAILDVDGTLVDTNYHHTLAWYRTFRAHDIVIPVWRLHRHVGMGGDKYVAALAGEDVEERLGDALRDQWKERFDEMLDEIEPFEGAKELLHDLKERGRSVVLASSAIESHLDRFLDLLEAREVVDGWTTSEDVEASKPEPDLVEAALAKAGTRDAAMLGDTGWDVEAAAKAGIETVCLTTGGWSAQELRASGARAVFESISDLRKELDATPL